MKKLLLSILCSVTTLLMGQTHNPPDVELVESVPIETTLGEPTVRSTDKVWLEMIRNADSTIDIEQFYISDAPNKKMGPILEAIIQAAHRGVKIRIIVDAKMYNTYPESVDRLAKEANIQVRKINFGKITGGIQHAKYFIIDNNTVFVGSQNFDWRALEHIHEVGVRIKSHSLALTFNQIFDVDWCGAENEGTVVLKEPKNQSASCKRVAVLSGNDTVFVIPTSSPLKLIPDSILWDEDAIVRLIDNAKRSLFLQFLSYSPLSRKSRYPVIDEALRRAAHRNVKIKMIVSDWEKGSSAVASLKELVALPNIEIAFSCIPEWSGGYISYARVEHCKFIVADSTSFWLGSSNCEYSYYYNSRNVGISLTHPSLATTLSRIFLRSWHSPYMERITQEGYYLPREHGEKQ